MHPPQSFVHHDMDAPPWWHFHKRPYIYIDGFAEKGHRGLMQFMLIPENGPEFFREHEDEFRDVLCLPVVVATAQVRGPDRCKIWRSRAGEYSTSTVPSATERTAKTRTLSGSTHCDRGNRNRSGAIDRTDGGGSTEVRPQLVRPCR